LEKAALSPMRQNPTELMLRVAARLVDVNAFDSATLRRLSKGVEDVDLLMSNAQHLSEHQRHAFSQPLRTVDAGAIDWKQVRRKLRELAVDQRQKEILRNRRHRETAPLWNFKLLKNRPLGGKAAHVREATRIGDGTQEHCLLRIEEEGRHRLILHENGKSVVEYPLELDWSAHIHMAVHRDGKTFVPISRLFGPSACRLILLEHKQILVSEEMGDGWIQPVGLLWHRERLLFLLARGDRAVDGITQIEVTSLQPKKPKGEPARATLS